MPECKWCHRDIDFDEGYARHESEWCPEKPPEGQQTLEEATH